ncbi:hypothetical protein KAR91_05635 [Candidatus Pacearchaeota archaeon]|nr:hypothetical protein [Candidatus Pacearchaeota archaeon]
MKLLDAFRESGKVWRGMGDFAEVDLKGVLRWSKSGEPVATIIIITDEWEAYPGVKEIKPENPGETWEYDAKALKIFTLYGDNLSLIGIDETGQKSLIPKNMIHGKNGFTRIEPPVGVWGKSAIQNDKYEAAQKYASEVARQALDFLHEIKKDKP